MNGSVTNDDIRIKVFCCCSFSRMSKKPSTYDNRNKHNEMQFVPRQFVPNIMKSIMCVAATVVLNATRTLPVYSRDMPVPLSVVPPNY